MDPAEMIESGADPHRHLHPPIEPFDTGVLEPDGLHRVYYEQCGNPDGRPVLFLHGGPGGGGDTTARRFFCPDGYRAVLLDQRGCGRSTPHAELTDNTTWHLIADIEQLRERLGIERWHVFGGSWGSTLALLYAQAHPDRVSALVLRGIFMLRPAELQWFYQQGANRIWPDRWERFLAPIPEDERDDLLGAYHRRLTGADHAEALACARAWSVWEGSTSCLVPSADLMSRFGAESFALAMARIESHYFVNGGFMAHPDQILEDVDRIRGIPAVIVHGRYDVVCPVENAWDLHRVWPEAELCIVDAAGHSAFEPGIRHRLLEATDRLLQV